MAAKRGPDYIYLIKGIQTGGICERKEIDDFVKDKKQLTLLTAAFKVMSERPKDDVLSYYQLAGLIYLVLGSVSWPFSNCVAIICVQVSMAPPLI